MSKYRDLRRLVAVSVLSAVVIGSAPSVMAQTSDDVERERRRLEQARANAAAALEELEAANAALDAAIIEMNEVNGELAHLTWKSDQLRTRTADYRAESQELRENAETLVRNAYVGRPNDLLATSLEASTLQDVVSRRIILEHATSSRLTSITRLEAVSREMDRLQLVLSADLDRVSELRALSDLVLRRMESAQLRADDALERARDLAADQLEDFKEAERLKRLKELEEKRRKEGAGGGLPITRTPGWQCPVPGGRFTNDWGAARSGGRTHKGTDIFAPRGTHTLASSSGWLSIVDVWSKGGKMVWLVGDDGIQYYYAHLDGYPDGIRRGSRVEKGQVVGFVGNTGNAITTSPHLHFEMHPGGGAAVNPYPTLVAHC